MKGNTNKCHLILSFNDSNEVKIGNSLIKRSNCEQLLGVKIDTKLTFDDHIKDQWKKANSKVGALGRVTQYMGLAKTKLLMNSFFAPKFNYCPQRRIQGEGGGAGGAGPLLFSQSLVYFAVTLENYKLCYSKLNWSLIMHF